MNETINTNKRKIANFRDLEVYQKAYSLSINVMTKITPLIPEKEKFDLKDQLARSCKSIPRLIAEGYGKKHQRLGFQKYLDDAMGESNETIVSLCHVRDIYKVMPEFCDKMIDEYEVLGRRIYCLSEAWENFKLKGKKN